MTEIDRLIGKEVESLRAHIDSEGYTIQDWHLATLIEVINDKKVKIRYSSDNYEEVKLVNEVAITLLDLIN